MTRDAQEPDPKLPQRLGDELAELHPRIDVPADLDRAILSKAQQQFAQRRRMRLLLRWGGGAVAAAAGIAAAIMIAIKPPSPSDHATHMAVQPTPAPTTLPHPNILDALTLARKIDRTPPAQRPLDWDINHDGVVNDADPKAIAMQVVKLDGGAP